MISKKKNCCRGGNKREERIINVWNSSPGGSVAVFTTTFGRQSGMYLFLLLTSSSRH